MFKLKCGCILQDNRQRGNEEQWTLSLALSVCVSLSFYMFFFFLLRFCSHSKRCITTSQGNDSSTSPNKYMRLNDIFCVNNDNNEAHL